MAKDEEHLNSDLYDEDDEDTQKDKYLTFQLADEEYGIEIYHVTEVVGLQKNHQRSGHARFCQRRDKPARSGDTGYGRENPLYHEAQGIR